MPRGVLTCLFALVLAAAFAASVSAAPPGPVQASIDPQASLAGGGTAVVVQVSVTCAGGSDVLEAFVYVTQDGESSPFTAIPVRCSPSGRTYAVRVPAPEGSVFHAGTASASGYVLVDKRGRRFHAVVTELEQLESGRFELALRPIDPRISYRSATVREVEDVWRRARRA